MLEANPRRNFLPTLYGDQAKSDSGFDHNAGALPASHWNDTGPVRAKEGALEALVPLLCQVRPSVSQQVRWIHPRLPSASAPSLSQIYPHYPHYKAKPCERESVGSGHRVQLETGNASTSRERFGRLLAIVFRQSDKPWPTRKSSGHGQGRVYTKCWLNPPTIAKLRASENKAPEEKRGHRLNLSPGE